MTTTPNAILQHVVERSPWVDPAATVDTLKYGDGEKTVTKAAVCWYPAIDNLREAARLRCDLMVTHEPLWWDHWGRERQWEGKEPGIERRRVLDEAGLAVIRLHDTWDNWPRIGIRDSFARGLGFDKFVGEDSTRWRATYEVPAQTLRSLARHVAEKVRPLGEDAVQVIGDPDMIVTRPSIGVGCGGPAEDMIALGSDALIVCFDGASYWQQRERFAEHGVGVISLEHGTTEMWGLEAMADYLRQTFAGLDVVYLDRHPRAWHVVASETA